MINPKYIIKTILHFIRDGITFIFTFKSPQEQENSVIIIRNDAIGDYLLFRNFLSIIRKYYPKHHITLLGNTIWSDLAINLDNAFVDNFIFINTTKFRRNIIYRICFLRHIKQYKFSVLINPIHSRDELNFTLSCAIYAHFKVAPQGDFINARECSKRQNDTIYTQILPSSNNVCFEFYRNREFFTNLFKKSLNTSLHIDTTLLPSKSEIENLFGIPSNYSVLFIGASAKYRQWSIKHFAKVGTYLIQKYHQNIVICGGKDDFMQAQNLKILLESSLDSTPYLNNTQIVNLAGQTSLIQLAGIVYNGNYLISNETSCTHLGAILDTTIIVVSNGNHLGRFIPYPTELADKYYSVFHPFIEENLQQYKTLSNTFAYKSTLDINEISPNMVINVIDKIKEKRCKTT